MQFLSIFYISFSPRILLHPPLLALPFPPPIAPLSAIQQHVHVFLSCPFLSNSARIARGQQVEPKEFPNTWRDDPESQAQANLTLNSFAHEIVDTDRIPNRVLDEDEQDYLIQEDAIKPAEWFQSFHFHHASAGKSQERNDRLVSSYI